MSNPTMPVGINSPSRYQPNPIDDRAMTGALSRIYLSLSTAIEETERILEEERATFVQLDQGTRTAIRTAESALRRAAFSVVLHAPE